MNRFEALCRLASDEKWCWKLFCTTCGHMHFRYALAELATGKSPEDQDWLVHASNTRYDKILGALPRNYSEEEKDIILDICSKANISSIASMCAFPDWLGYLGIVLAHMLTDSYSYKSLSATWASQLSAMVQEDLPIHARLQEISNSGGILDISDLEECEAALASARR